MLSSQMQKFFGIFVVWMCVSPERCEAKVQQGGVSNTFPRGDGFCQVTKRGKY